MIRSPHHVIGKARRANQRARPLTAETAKQTHDVLRE